MMCPEAKRLRMLDDENRRPKKLLAQGTRLARARRIWLLVSTWKKRSQQHGVPGAVKVCDVYKARQRASNL
jgi:hypothetical protein